MGVKKTGGNMGGFWFFEIKGILFEDSIGLEFCDGSHDEFLFVVCFFVEIMHLPSWDCLQVKLWVLFLYWSA